MNLRKVSSNHKKSTPIPSDLRVIIEDTLTDKYKEELMGKKLIVSGRIYLEEIHIIVGFKEPQALRQTNFEASIDFDPQKSKVIDDIHLLLDSVDGMMAEYFADPNIRMPLSWLDFEFENKTVYMRLTPDNTEIEDQTRAFIRTHGNDQDLALIDEPLDSDLH